MKAPSGLTVSETISLDIVQKVVDVRSWFDQRSTDNKYLFSNLFTAFVHKNNPVRNLIC